MTTTAALSEPVVPAVLGLPPLPLFPERVQVPLSEDRDVVVLIKILLTQDSTCMGPKVPSKLSQRD